MYYLGLDIGSSSIKVALVEIANGKQVGVVQEPESEMDIIALKNGWAEQDPKDWWRHVCAGIKNIKAKFNIHQDQIKGIGIAYQMHGLVLLDKQGKPVRNAIIWCDSRAVEIGRKAYATIGEENCKSRLLNSPANFTASKLKWVQENEADLYSRAHKLMLPGDYIAYCFSRIMNTTISGLSEGILWDFKEDSVANLLLEHYGIPNSFIPDIVDTFSLQCTVDEQGALESGLAKGTPILYRAGDQPNNALSLNVFNPGEVAATGGTSGVVYAVTDSLSGKESTRVNNFAHVNYNKSTARIGKLLNINGAGIQYRWLLNNLEVGSYEEMNALAKEIPVGSDGVCLIPFGNGAERMLNNRDIGSRLLNINLNNHHKGHICRAALEGVAFSFAYGMEILRSDGIEIQTMRAGNDNLFRSEIFSNTLASLVDQEIEIYDTTGAIGAARAAGIYEGGFEKFSTYITNNDHIHTFKPSKEKASYVKAFNIWKEELEMSINSKK
ncbi:Xylulose kinase [Arenibacter antarcticus]|uniref:Xylulokinase n=1 Tax=Arenibacter antarcticus TaxID=2040469 RepID=A0ABW5VE31_9FLAO|nr:FGGY family carbohydrate kinase [Arenibacter sp. H213]MCM4167699.1 carbohydrate kinase [Arenibacter sp. H213]